MSSKSTTHLSGTAEHTLCGERENMNVVESIKDVSCYYCKQAWENKQAKISDNKKTRLEINELYGRVRDFQSDKLSPIMNPDLYIACEKIPELKEFSKELDAFLTSFNERLVQFADDKYPIK